MVSTPPAMNSGEASAGTADEPVATIGNESFNRPVSMRIASHAQQRVGSLASWALPGRSGSVEASGQFLRHLTLADNALFHGRLEPHRCEWTIEGCAARQWISHDLLIPSGHSDGPQGSISESFNIIITLLRALAPVKSH